MVLDVEALSDAELRSELISAGFNIGPITGTSRRIYEKKLNEFLNGKGKHAAKAKSATPKPKAATPKPVAPAKKTSEPPKSLNRSSMNSSTRSSTSSSKRPTYSELEEEDSDEDEIVSPLPVKTPTRKPVVSTPEKVVTPVKSVTKSYTSSSSYKRSESPVEIPNLITDFTPSFARPSDHPGATPPRAKIGRGNVSKVVTTVYTPKHDNTFAQRNRFGDLGATTAEEDNDDDDGIESSRVIFNSNQSGPTRRGLVGKAWDKVLGYDFRTSSKPGENYDFRTGTTRTSVRRDPRTGAPRVLQTSVVSDWIRILLTSLVILAVLLTIAFVVTQPKETFTSSYAAFKTSVRDTGNFLYRYAILPVITGLVVVALVVGGYFGYKKYNEVKEQEEIELINLVERIFTIIKDAKNEGEPYISQPHVRDIIFPPIKRRGADLNRWERAVDFIDKHDSRVITEIRITPSGNECPVWIWVGVESKGRRY